MQLNGSLLPIGKFLAKVPEVKEKTSSGIYIPEQAKKQQLVATVVKAGKPLDPNPVPGCDVGSQVTYKKYHQEFVLDGEKYIYLDANDIVLYTESK